MVQLNFVIKFFFIIIFCFRILEPYANRFLRAPRLHECGKCFYDFYLYVKFTFHFLWNGEIDLSRRGTHLRIAILTHLRMNFMTPQLFATIQFPFSICIHYTTTQHTKPHQTFIIFAFLSLYLNWKTREKSNKNSLFEKLITKKKSST